MAQSQASNNPHFSNIQQGTVIPQQSQQTSQSTQQQPHVRSYRNYDKLSRNILFENTNE